MSDSGLDELAKEIDSEESLDEALETPEDTSKRLQELGVKADSLEALSPEAQKALIPILKDRQGDFSRRTSELADEIKTLKAALKETVNRPTEPAPTVKEDGPPDGASDQELFNYHVKAALNEELESLRREVRETRYMTARQQLEHFRSTHDDFASLEPKIAATMRKHPTMDMAEAYEFVRAEGAADRAIEALRERVRNKSKVNTLKGGTKGSVPKSLKDVDTSEMSAAEKWNNAKRIAAERLREQGIEIDLE